MYKTNVLAQQHGHEVVHLPVAHCELNPIELAWAVVKDYCRKHNETFTLRGIEEREDLRLFLLICGASFVGI